MDGWWSPTGAPDRTINYFSSNAASAPTSYSATPGDSTQVPRSTAQPSDRPTQRSAAPQRTGADAQSPQTRYAIERLKITCQLKDQYAGLYTLGKQFDDGVDYDSVPITPTDLEEELFEDKMAMDTTEIQAKLDKLDLFGLQGLLNQFSHFHTGEPFVLNSSAYTVFDMLLANEVSDEQPVQPKKSKKKSSSPPPSSSPAVGLKGTPLDVCIHHVLTGCSVSHLCHLLFAGEVIFVAFNLTDLSDVCLLLYYKNVERLPTERDIYYSMSAYTYNDFRTAVVSASDDLKQIKTLRVELCGSTLALSMDITHLCSNVKQMNVIAE